VATLAYRATNDDARKAVMTPFPTDAERQAHAARAQKRRERKMRSAAAPTCQAPTSQAPTCSSQRQLQRSRKCSHHLAGRSERARKAEQREEVGSTTAIGEGSDTAAGALSEERVAGAPALVAARDTVLRCRGDLGEPEAECGFGLGFGDGGGFGYGGGGGGFVGGGGGPASGVGGGGVGVGGVGGGGGIGFLGGQDRSEGGSYGGSYSGIPGDSIGGGSGGGPASAAVSTLSEPGGMAPFRVGWVDESTDLDEEGGGGYEARVGGMVDQEAHASFENLLAKMKAEMGGGLPKDEQ
jgi:hypothetical protein